MAEDLQLPFDLFDDGFFAGSDERARAGSERDKEQSEYLASLTRPMAESFLLDEALKLEGPIDLRQRWRHREQGLVIQPRRTTPDEISSLCLAHYQMQAARILHLKQQQQLVQPKLFAALKGLSDSSKGARNVYNPSHSGWSPHHIKHQPHPGSGMRAMFLRGSSARKESIGTGVFLPRTAGSKAESQKKSDGAPLLLSQMSCSTVLIPARVVQALNLNLEELGAQARFPGGFVLEHDYFAGRRKLVRNHNRSQPEPAAMRSHISSLPQEWTY